MRKYSSHWTFICIPLCIIILIGFFLIYLFRQNENQPINVSLLNEDIATVEASKDLSLDINKIPQNAIESADYARSIDIYNYNTDDAKLYNQIYDILNKKAESQLPWDELDPKSKCGTLDDINWNSRVFDANPTVILY